jgi:hypothetical protein
MNAIEETFGLLNGLRGLVIGAPSTAAEVDNLANDLGVTLPEEFRAFLMTAGFVQWFGERIYGIDKSMLSQRENEDCRPKTFEWRATCISLDVESLAIEEQIVVADDGGGGVKLLSCANDKTFGTVRYYIVSEQLSPIDEWRCFSDYLKSRVDIGRR